MESQWNAVEVEDCVFFRVILDSSKSLSLDEVCKNEKQQTDFLSSVCCKSKGTFKSGYEPRQVIIAHFYLHL